MGRSDPRRAAVVGSPIEHSLSPVLHGAAYRELGLDGWSYERIERDAAGLAELVPSLGPEWVGLSVTMPGKQAALGLADEVVVLDVYGAREDPQPGVTGELIADAVPLPAERVHFEPSLTEAAPRVAGLVRPGDVVVTMGAGDVTMLGPEILAEVDRGAAER